MLMSTETLNRDCIVILTNILSLYKKCLSIGMSRYWVSQYLASFLSVISEIMLEPVIDNLFSILHEMVNIVFLKLKVIIKLKMILFAGYCNARLRFSNVH
jgi:hypothetical protein